MDRLRLWLESARARAAAASPRTRVMVVAAVATALALGLFAYARATTTNYEVLFHGLESDDAARIVARLREDNVPYRLDGEGTILVDAAKVHETRLALAEGGLPSGGGVGFELFDQQRFGESEFAEQVQYRRALEGELSRTIRSIEGVEGARVHLVLPQRSLFVSNEASASASVALRLERGFRLRDEQVRGIVHLVASSVRNLDPAHVTLVDGEGRRLSSGDEEEEAATGAEELRTRVQRERQRAAQQLLDTTLGQGKAVVEVAADVTFAREERVEESYDPEHVATRSFEIEQDGATAAGTATQGVPGAVSALPGGAAAEPLAGAAGSAGRRRETRNYEITKVVHRAVQPIGRVTRLQAAVVVDGTWRGEGAQRTFVPRTAEEMARIETMVASTIGIDASRGDTVTVTCVPFPDVPVESEPVGALPILEDPRALTYGGAALGGLALLVVAAALLIARRRRKKKAERVALEIASGATAPSLPVPAHAALGAGKTEESDDAEKVRKLTVEIARNDPQLAARVVRSWLNEGGIS